MPGSGCCDDALPIETRPQLSTIRLQSAAAGTEAVRMLVTAVGRPEPTPHPPALDAAAGRTASAVAAPSRCVAPGGQHRMVGIEASSSRV